MKNNKVSEFAKDPKKALFTLAWPITVSMLVQVMYNIIDTAFVGRLGSESIAALTFSFPFFLLMTAITSGLNIGFNALISRLVGANQKRKAENAAIHAFYMTILVSILFTFFGLVFIRPMFVSFGAKDNVLDLGMKFMRIVFAGSTLMFLSYAITSMFTAQGDAKTATKVQVISLIVNIILDPIFIFVLGFGVEGAAISTVIAFAVAFLLGLYYMYVKGGSSLKINFPCFNFSSSIIRDILKVGFPAMLMQFIISFYVVIINWFMAHFGTDYVAAFGLGSRLESVAVLPFIGISISMLTLVAMFIGAKKMQALKHFIWYGIKISVLISSLLGAIFFFFPGLLFRIFTADPLLIALSSAYMRIDVFTFPLMAIGFAISRVIQAMGDGLAGLVVTLTRVLFVFVPVAYFFVFVLRYGFLSVAFTMVIAGIVSNVVGVVWLMIKLKNLPAKVTS